MSESIDSVNGAAAHGRDPQCCASCGCSHSTPAGGDEAFDVRREVIKLVAAAVLFAGVLLLEYTDVIRLPEIGFYVFISAAYLTAGVGILAAAGRTLVRGDFFDENVLMAIATLGAMAIGAFSEAVGVMIFYRAGEFLQGLAVSRSRRSIAALLAQRPDVVNLKTEAGISRVAPESVAVGSLVLVKPGEKIPLDGRITDGASQVDTSALTGESVPRGAGAGDEVLAGGVNLSGTLTIAVTRPYDQSSIARMVELVENAAARKSATEQFITVFARYYTPAVVAAAAAVAFVPPMLIDGAGFQQWIYRALVLLVISCPCALVISIPLGYFGGVGRASRQGILVKGSNFLDALAKVDTVVFDKTGTLTQGVFTVDRIAPENGFSSDQVLQYAAAAELHSTHPIGKSILEALEARGLAVDESLVTDHAAIAGRGVQAVYNGIVVAVGNDGLLHDRQIDHGRCTFESTVAHVVVDDRYAGHILIGDRIKPDALQAVSRLREQGVSNLVMMTGDNECTAEVVAKTLGMDRFYAELLPEDKVRIFEEIKAASKEDAKVAFVGDGINDAPVLARADVGVAMGALGSDAAIETADVVLMTDSPLKMAEGIETARRTRTIVWQNIVMALSIKMVFVVLGTMGMASMWEAVFADMGVAVAAIVNSTRVLRAKGFAEPKPVALQA